MRKVLSVIVPAYNAESYIRKCLDAFAASEEKELFEVIVVNDGSTDRTEAIANEYCNRYPEVFRVVNKENGGHGSAINVGMEHVSGVYFQVVDSDDWVDSAEFDRFVQFLSQIDVDLVASNFMCIEDETWKILDQRVCMKDKALCGVKLKFDDVAASVPLIRIHSLTINTDFYRRKQIAIDSYRYYVDFEYTLYPATYAETIAFYDGFVRMYRLGRAGQSVSIESMWKHRDNHMQVIESLLRWYENHSDISPEKKKYLDSGIAKIVENQFQIYISLAKKEKGTEKEMRQFDQMLKKQYEGIYNAVEKKSIWLLRCTNYKILPIAYIAYRLIKG